MKKKSQRNDDLIIEGTILDAIIEIKQGQAPYSVKSDIHLFYFSWNEIYSNI